MPLFNWGRSPDLGITQPPREPAGAALVDEARIVELDEAVYIAKCQNQTTLVDRLLDLRNAIRPANPAAPAELPRRRP